jgi:hypothetical protein
MFVSERGDPFTTDGFNWLVAKLPFQAHAHMLRHIRRFIWIVTVSLSTE